MENSYLEILTARQKQILAIVVSAYVETVSPVGSKMITEKFPFDISSATIRNEMMELEALGFVTHPHTSAGRIPTDRGYRYFVDSLMSVQEVDGTEAALVAYEFRQKAKSIDDVMDRTSRILSSLTEQAGWILYPNWSDLILKRIELIPYGRSHILVVFATTSGLVQSKIVNMDEEIPEAELYRLNHFLNQELAGKFFSEMQSYLTVRLSEVRDSISYLYRYALKLTQSSLAMDDERRIALDGSRYVLRQPEFQSVEKTKALSRLLESKETLREVFAAHGRSGGTVTVRIGRENGHEDIWDCSLVTAEYRFQDQRLGTLGILGPRRMAYGKVVAIVDHISRRLTDALESLV